MMANPDPPNWMESADFGEGEEAERSRKKKRRRSEEVEENENELRQQSRIKRAQQCEDRNVSNKTCTCVIL